MKKITSILILGLIVLLGLNLQLKRVRYNVVLITIDTARVDKFGIYGSDVKTPNFDSLARKSILFLNHHTPINFTSPSHTTILSGLYPKNHGVYDNFTKVHQSIPTLDIILQKEGYRTGAFVTASFLKLMGVGNSFGEYFSSDDKNSLAVEKSIQWMRSQKESPFFMWLHIYAPHWPYEPPEKYKKLYENRFNDKWIIPGFKLNNPDIIDEVLNFNEYISNYEGEISYTDFLIGKVLSELSEKEQFSKSIIIITADHGESLGEHEIYGNHNGLFNEVSQIPLLIYIPGVGSKKIKDVTSNIDLVPTVLDILKIPLNKLPVFDGISLKSIIFENKKLSRENIFLEESYYLSKGIIENQHKLIYRWKHVNNFLPHDETNLNKLKIIIKSPENGTVLDYYKSKGLLVFRAGENQKFPANQKFRFQIETGAWSFTTLPVSNYLYKHYLSLSTWNGLAKTDLYARVIPENNKDRVEKSDFISFRLAPVEKDYYELYNLKNDTKEENNLFLKKKELSNRLIEKVKNWEGERIYFNKVEKGKSSEIELDRMRALGYLQ